MTTQETLAAGILLPSTVHLAARPITFRHMTPEDAAAMLAFGRAQTPDDLLFLRRDITNPEDIQQWVARLGEGDLLTILAARPDGGILGYASVDRSNLRWTRHVAEIRVLVDRSARSIGLGRTLLSVAFEEALAAGVSKIVAQMVLAQEQARRLFEELGFEPEAVLRDHVRDAAGLTHDLLMMSFQPVDHHMRACDDCGRHVLARLPLEGRLVCWSCYEIRYGEIGAAD